MRSYESIRKYDKEAHFRFHNGISKCYTCNECGKMFGQIGKGYAKYCLDCRKENERIQKALNITIWQVRRMLFASGHNDMKELKGLREEMVSEEGPEFAEWLTGPVCKHFKQERREESE
jgi:hypothetical protein